MRSDPNSGEMNTWIEKRLEELGTTQTGSTPKAASKESYGDFVPFVKPSDFNADGSLNYEADGLSKHGLSEARKIPAGSVLMVCIGATIGKTGWCDRDITTNQQINALIPHDGVSQRFVYYQMLTEDFQRRVLSSSAQATLPIINKSKWSALTVALAPTLEEQLRIVGILDEAFEGIATAKANAEKNIQNARALFESHLQSIFALRGDGWPIRKLGELSDQITDGTHNSPPYVKDGIPMLDSKHVMDGFLIDDTAPEKFISPDIDAMLAKRCKPRAGDILISSRGSIGKLAIVREGQNFNIMGNMILIRLPLGVNREFVAFYLSSQITHIESIARGVAQKGLYLNQIRDYELPLPPEAKQAQIGKQLDALSAETQRLASIYQQKLAALDELKKSLLHQAFSGEL